jgi:pectate lyase
MMTARRRALRSLSIPLALVALSVVACGGDKTSSPPTNGAEGAGGGSTSGAGGSTSGAGSATSGTGGDATGGGSASSSASSAASSGSGGSSSASSGVGGGGEGGGSDVPVPPVFEEGPVGFASLNGGTTGGKGGATVTVSDAAALLEAVSGTEPRVVQIQGTISLEGMNDVGSNKTIVGLGTDAKIVGGGLYLYKEKNVIIRNITFQDSSEDAIGITTDTTNVWVDHCTLMNGADGLIDISRKSSFVTLSWNVFRNHHKTILIGHSDAASSDIGFLKVTLHHNWFDATLTRHPSVRFGQVHVFNNFYNENLSYGIASRMEADLVVEGNYFLNTWFPCVVGYADSEPGDLVEHDNLIETTKPAPKSDDPNDPPPPAVPVCATRGASFDPKPLYPYTPDAPGKVQALVSTYAGAGKM